MKYTYFLGISNPKKYCSDGRNKIAKKIVLSLVRWFFFTITTEKIDVFSLVNNLFTNKTIKQRSLFQCLYIFQKNWTFRSHTESFAY